MKLIYSPRKLEYVDPIIYEVFYPRFRVTILLSNLQRLSSSVSMVSKGVLKEHLLLLANSMTYCGNMIGFNSGGYKALSRSLNVQVPFTEATLIVRNWNFLSSLLKEMY